MEVVARKKRGLTPLFITILAFGILLSAGGIVCFTMGGYSILPAIILTVLGVAIAALGAILWFKWKKMPDEIVCVEDGKMYLPEGVCALSELLNVSYRCPLNILKARWGNLYLEFEGKVRMYGFVEEAEETQQALVSLRLSDCKAPIDR